MRNLYTVLGVKKTADPAAIKKAYRTKAKKLHPDRNPGDETAKAKFEEVQLAYDVLIDPVRRDHYDQTGEVGKSHDNRTERLIPLLNQVLMNVIHDTVNEGRKVTKVHLVDRMRKWIEQHLKNLKDSAGILKSTLGRYTNHDGNENVLEALVKQTLRLNEEEVKQYEDAKDFLKTYGYKKDDTNTADNWFVLGAGWTI